MKKLFSLLLLCGILVNTQAQKLEAKDVPAPVTDAFSKTNPTVKDADWKKDGKYYKVMFQVNKLDNSITYDINADIAKTEEGLPVLNLPKCVADYVRINYRHHNIKKACKITDAGSIVSYKAKVDDMYLHFDSNCNFLSSEKDTE